MFDLIVQTIQLFQTPKVFDPIKSKKDVFLEFSQKILLL